MKLEPELDCIVYTSAKRDVKNRYISASNPVPLHCPLSSTMIPNAPKSPATPHVPQSRPGSYAGWYDNASVFSQINLEETQSLAYNRSPDVEGMEHITSPMAMSSRERVRSIRMKRGTVQQEGTTTHFKGAERARSRSYVSHESAIASSQALGGSEQTGQRPTERREKERLTILMPEECKNPIRIRKEEPGSTIRQRPSPRSALPEAQPTPTTDKIKSRKSARLTRLIVEKIILKVDESPVSSNGGDLEEGQQAPPKVRSYKLKPVQIALETFFLLLPMLGALYMLASCCLPNTWWRQRLSIVRINLAAVQKGDEPAALLLGLWGWCITQGEAVR
jgi:hypothetical protein